MTVQMEIHHDHETTVFFLGANSSFSPTSFYFLCSFFLPSIIYCLSLTRIGNCLFANSLTTTSPTIRRVVVAVMFFAWCLLQLLLLLSFGLLICNLISENIGLEKSRSISNRNFFSCSANLSFFQVSTLKKS